ncbi:MAG: HD domain-containing protein [Clostridia bacterium]|nr:HD domain-containing protein [Clostridia bacterium]
MENAKQKFIEIYTKYIKREGADKLLEYLDSPASDFFTAPASARFHSSYESGLVEHSLNVYTALKGYLESDRVKNVYGFEYSEESIAIVALLHDLCKVNVYKKGFRNVKDEKGVWQRVDTFEFDDKLPYGHGEKSVYIISGYMKLTREEAFAIRYHMGYSSTEDPRNVSAAFEMFPLAFALSTADSEATYFMETEKGNK